MTNSFQAVFVMPFLHPIRHEGGKDQYTFGERICEKDIIRYVNAVKVLCSQKTDKEEYKKCLGSLLHENEELFNNLSMMRHTNDEDEERGSIITLSTYQTSKLNKILALITKIEEMKVKRNYGIPVSGNFLKTAIKAINRSSKVTVWLEEDENKVLSLCCTPKDINNILYNRVWNRNVSHVLTSGTISDGMDFEYFKEENGISQIPRIAFVSNLLNRDLCLYYNLHNLLGGEKAMKTSVSIQADTVRRAPDTFIQ